MSHSPDPPDLHAPPVPGGTDAELPVGVTGSPDSPTHSSRIITLEKSSIFLYLTLLFVFANIILPRWVAFGFLFVLLVLLASVLLCSRRPQKFPPWFRPLSENFQNRLKENPPEIFLIFGIIFLSLCSNLLLAGPNYGFAHRAREALSVLLVAAAFVINQYRRPYDFGRHSIWDIFSKETAQVKVRREPEPDPSRPTPTSPASPATQSQVLRADYNRRQWEEKQRERWESWMDEEVDRLNDEPSKDKKPEPPKG